MKDSAPPERARLPGRVVGLLLFALGGLPFIVLFSLGERPCDVGAGPPCTIGWGTRLLIVFAVVLTVCAVVGWLANRLIDILSKGPSER